MRARSGTLRRCATVLARTPTTLPPSRTLSPTLASRARLSLLGLELPTTPPASSLLRLLLPPWQAQPLRHLPRLDQQMARPITPMAPTARACHPSAPLALLRTPATATHTAHRSKPPHPTPPRPRLHTLCHTTATPSLKTPTLWRWHSCSVSRRPSTNGVVLALA